MNNKEFEFDKIGKRMPYTTPEGFFDKLEDDIWNGVKQEAGHKSLKVRLLMRSVVAMAAAIALLLVIHLNFKKSSYCSMNDVDIAFSQLSTDDQAYLLSVYQDDVFVNE